MSALALERVAAVLGGVRVVDGVTADVGDGEWVVVIGPNGAGKTTLLRAVAGLVPYEGRISLFGEDARRLTRKELARRVALVPQVPTMPPEASVGDYVLLGRTPHVSYFGSQGRSDREVAAAALERLDLADLAHRRLDSLSGGERQRATLARALAQDAPILLLDEPTAALDLGHAQQLLELVDRLRLQSGLTVVTTLHDLVLAGQYAERLVLLAGGRVAAAGRPQDVLTREALAEHYGATADVSADATGVRIHPLRPTVVRS